MKILKFLAAALIAVVVGTFIEPGSADAAIIKPTVTGFAASTTAFNRAGGTTFLSATVAHATTCVFSSNKVPGGLPYSITPCEGLVTYGVTLPPNAGKAPVGYTFMFTAYGSVAVKGKPAVKVKVGVGLPAPGIPLNVTATSNADAQSVVSWTAPASNGGTAVTGYTVTATPGGSTCTSTTVLTCTVTGLTNGTSYTFTVAATNTAGTSTPSAPSAAAVPATTPDAPTGVAATSNADAQSVVSWTAPASNGGSAVTGYTVTPYIGGVAQAPQIFASVIASQAVTGLTNGTSYTFTVAATNTAGTSTPSTPSAAAVPAATPGAPTGVAATALNASLSVTWHSPLVTGGSPITGYRATASPGGSTCTISGTTCVITGLTNGVSYTVTVVAINAAGTGSPSSPSSLAIPFTVPNAPPGLGVSSVGANTANVGWSVPNANGSAISSYVVTGLPSCGIAGTGCSASGMTANTGYTVCVAAVNAAGQGASACLGFTTAYFQGVINAAGYGCANQRTAPNTNAGIISCLGNGTVVNISCQTIGQNVLGYSIWDMLSDGSYVWDYNMSNTAVATTFDSRLRQC